jgi:hypothetical protein
MNSKLDSTPLGKLYVAFVYVIPFTIDSFIKTVFKNVLEWPVMWRLMYVFLMLIIGGFILVLEVLLAVPASVGQIICMLVLIYILMMLADIAGQDISSKEIKNMTFFVHMLRESLFVSAVFYTLLGVLIINELA